MYTLVIIIHLVVCFLMIASILLQAGKGAEIGASFGGSSQTVFGSRGPGTFLSKVTVAAAMIFMLTSLSLAVFSRGSGVASSVIEIPATTETSTPNTGSATTTEPTHSEQGHTNPDTQESTTQESAESTTTP